MAKLSDQLERIKEGAKKRIPPAALAIMERATEELRQSGITQRVLKAAQAAPEFSLPDASGTIISSAELLKNGPLVVSFYRGKW